MPSSPSSDEERGSRRKESGRRKQKRKKECYDETVASRKTRVRAWAGSETKPAKDYYVDAKGDHDNLAFGSLYRSDHELFNAAYRSNCCSVADLCAELLMVSLAALLVY